MYFSRLLTTRVKDSSDRYVGRLKDILIQPHAGYYSPLLFLLVKSKSGELLYIPYEYIGTMSSQEIILKNLIGTIPTAIPEGTFAFLNRDIMDEQIVDLEGARVVRVNDLKLGTFENQMCVLGIDVSFKGILRRLHLDWLDLLSLVKINLIDWRKTHLVKGVLKLDTISDDLVQLHPADLANIIEDLTVRQGSKLVDALEAGAAAEVVEEMDPEMQQTIINYLGPERAHDIVEKMSIDETVDLLQELPKEQARKFLSYLQESKSKKVKRLIAYPDDTAGGLMTTDYIEVERDWTVERAIEEVKKVSPDMRSLWFVYVTEPNDTFVGVVSLRNLLVTDKNERIETIMKAVPEQSILRLDQKVNEVITVMTKYNLISAAVLDDKKRLVGVVTIDDVMRYLAPKA